MLQKPVLLFIIAAGISTMIHAQGFVLTSPTIQPGATLSQEQVFNDFGCSGGNQSPALQWTAGPAGTKSYAVTVFDPDAPTGKGWWHWIVYDIPLATSELAAAAGDAGGRKLPAGARQGRTDFGTHAYGGPCPPRGDPPHRYVFTVYALKVAKIDAVADAAPATVASVIEASAIAHATLTATYGR